MERENIEIQLWSYIDNQCSDEDILRIENLLETNDNWKELYQQMLTFQQELIHADAEQPSLRFSKNVMETINATSIAPAAKSYVNLWMVRGIISLFVVMFTTAFIYLLTKANWSKTSSSFVFDYSRIDFASWLIPTVSINIILLMIFMDTLLRRKKTKPAKKLFMF